MTNHAHHQPRTRDQARRAKSARALCCLCSQPMAGARMELGATWVAHSTCYRELKAQAIARGGELAALTPDQLDARLRNVLTVRAVVKANAPAYRRKTPPR